MFKSSSALLIVAFSQFNWLINDQHFSLKKDKKKFYHENNKKIKDDKDNKKATSKPIQKQNFSRFKNFKQPTLQVIENFNAKNFVTKISTNLGASSEFTAQTRFNYSSIKAVWFGCCATEF